MLATPRSSTSARATLLAAILMVTVHSEAAGAPLVVLTEIMYHPQGGGRDLEWVEIHNAAPAAVDLSDWQFTRGITFRFPRQSWLAGGAYLVVCARADRVRQAYGIDNAIGDWGEDCGSAAEPGSGCSLDNGGETIELCEPGGVVVASVRYNDRGRWPAGADGTGHSLALRSVSAPQGDPESWTLSALRGGSPGEPNPLAQKTGAVINEGYFPATGARWIEVFNPSLTEETSLADYYLTDDRGNLLKARLGSDARIPPRGWLVLTDEDLRLDFTPRGSGSPGIARTFVALTHRDGLRVVDACAFEPRSSERSEARVPDGEGSFFGAATPTPGAANSVEVVRDVVINELMFHPLDGDPRGEFVELFHRGESPVHLAGWRMTRGLDFSFPESCVLAPGGYLVVARDPEYIARAYGLDPLQVVGPDPSDPPALEAFGRLRDGGEELVLRDAAGNVADRVRYDDGGEWPAWSDGGGSSLELIDPLQDNSVGAAWDASDDSARAEPSHFRYEGTYWGGEPELHLFLAHRGIALIDNLRVTEARDAVDVAKVIVDVGHEWRLFKGFEDPPADWTQPDFDDSTWHTGATPAGYGRGDENTRLVDMRGAYLALYGRVTFDDPRESTATGVVLEVDFDDAFVAFLNGTPIARENIVESGRRHDTPALRSFSGRSRIELGPWEHLLRPSGNVLAIEVHNVSATSNDLRFAPSLVAGRLVPADGPNLAEGGNFEGELREGTDAPGEWIVEGTHIRSGWTSRRSITGDGALEVIATSKGDSKVNRLEVALPPMEPGARYRVEFDGQWIVGSPVLVTHGYGHALARAHRLRVPPALGTPGALNSVTRRRIREVGSANYGPAISNVRQDPALPSPRQPVRISARVHDPDGVARVELLYGPSVPREIGDPLLGRTRLEGPDARGDFHGTIPPVDAGIVVFHIEAVDSRGFVGRFPRDRTKGTHPLLLDPDSATAPDRGHLVFGTGDHAPPADLPSFQIWLDDAAEEYLSRRQLHSNDPVEGSLLVDGSTIVYSSTCRFSGSPFARAAWTGSWRIHLPRDRPLYGRIDEFGLEDHQRGGGRSGRDRLSQYLLRHNQGHTKVPYGFHWLARLQVNDVLAPGGEVREHVEVPDGRFVGRWFPDDDEGDLFEVDTRHIFNDQGRRWVSEDARLTFPPHPERGGSGSDPEEYRGYFNPRRHKNRDSFGPLVDLARVMSPSATTDEAFDEVISRVIDLEQFLRVWAVRLNTDDWDSWGANSGKNAYLYRLARRDRWVLIPWDMELTYDRVDSYLPPSIEEPYTTINVEKFPEVGRMLNRPRVKRLYYRILSEMLSGPFRSDFLAPYVERLREEGLEQLEPALPGGFIDQRAELLRQSLEGALYPDVPVSITTGGGRPLTVHGAELLLEGLAPVDAAGVVIMGGSVGPVAAVFSDSDVFGWRASVPLGPGTTILEAVGFNSAGDALDSDSVEVTSLTAEFVRGDADGSGDVTITDGVTILLHRFASRPLDCDDAADANDDGAVELEDALRVFDFLFRRGPVLPPPFPTRGADPSADGLSCDRVHSFPGEF